jgi:hypothetical protein
MTANSSGYSTHVELYLIVNNRRLELGQVGSEHFTLRRPEDILPSRAEIVTIVDGDETRISVFLPAGASSANRRIPYQSLMGLPPAAAPLAPEIQPAIAAFQQQ